MSNARALTVEAHSGLVHKAAQHYARAARHLESQDLVQEGAIGLMRGLALFDQSRGVTPATYLQPWIRATVRRAICNQDRDVRVPVCTLDRKRRAGEDIPRALSLDALLGNGDEPDNRTLHDVLSADGLSPDDAAERSEAGARVNAALATLPERDRLVLRRRYWGDKTLLEVGTELGVTRERVRQIEVSALQRLRRALGAIESARPS